MTGTLTMLTDSEARAVAVAWHGGYGAPLHMFATTGATVSKRYALDDVLIAIEYLLLPHRVADSERYWPGCGDQLRALHAYVRRAGKRGPVQGWGE